MKSLSCTAHLIAVIVGLAVGCQAGRLIVKIDPLGETIEIAVATMDLPIGTLVEESDLAMLAFSKASLPPDVVFDVKELVNRRLNRTLKQGNWFSSTDVYDDYVIKIPDGMCKYPLNLDHDKVMTDGFQPDDRIDVILTETLSNKLSRSHFFRNILVVDVDTHPKACCSIFLAVTPEQAGALASAEKRSDVKIALRAAGPLPGIRIDGGGLPVPCTDD
jgi:Flp pilus assembly protein CpaB